MNNNTQCGEIVKFVDFRFGVLKSQIAQYTETTENIYYLQDPFVALGAYDIGVIISSIDQFNYVITSRGVMGWIENDKRRT